MKSLDLIRTAPTRERLSPSAEGTLQRLPAASPFDHSPRQLVQRQQVAHLFGPAAGLGRPVVQRYSVVDGDSYTIGSSGTIFRRHQIERTRYGYHTTRTESRYARSTDTLTDTTEALGREPDGDGALALDWRQTSASVAATLPPLKVSEGGMMALEASGQPSWFYADPSIVLQSNTILARNGADIRLQERNRRITVPSDPEADDPVADKTLKQVHAVPASGTDRGSLAEQLACPECNTFINYVMGLGQSARVAVVGTGLAEREVLAPSEREPKHALIDQIAKGKHRPKALADAAASRPTSSFNDAAEKLAIEDAYNEKTRTHYASAALGVNEYAAPEVGEGFLTVSNKEKLADIELDPAHDFRKPAAGEDDTYLEALQALAAADQQVDVMKLAVDDRIKAMKGTWGYHYAGVAARHGADVVTLENYNRGTENEWEVRRIFNALFMDCRKFREFVWSRTDHLSTGKLGEKARKDDLAAAAAAIEDGSLTLKSRYRRAVREAAEAASRPYAGAELIYFQMYGPKAKGQSFHQAFESSTANPLTLRLRNSRAQAREQGRADIRACRDALRITLASATSSDTVNRTLAAADVDTLANHHLGLVDAATEFLTIAGAATQGVNALKALSAQVVLDIGTALHGSIDSFRATTTVDEVIAEVDRQADKFRLRDKSRVKPLMLELNPILAALKQHAS